MKKNLNLLWVMLVSVVPVIYLAVVYSSLPGTVATHFGLKGEPDRFGPKSTLWLSTGMLSLVGIGVWLLLTNVNKIDPKKSSENRKEVLSKLAWVVIGFLCLLSLIIIQSSKDGKLLYTRFIFSAVGLMFALIGNYLPKIKQNYFAGFRTPWALESEYNWKITHQVAGKYWFWGGLAMVAGTLVLPLRIGIIFFFAVALIMVAVPLVKSYKIFKEEKRKSAV